MKIVTVNIPESYLESINRLLDNKAHPNGGMYPSRSELIRVAVRDFLIKEIRRAKEIILMPERDKLDPKKFVNVPQITKDENGDPIKEFITYKIVKRLEY